MNPNQHTTWCARGHRCGLGEHRADPVTLTVPGAGSTTLTRVRTAAGIEHVDVRLSITLPGDETQAQQRFTALLTHLRTLIGPARLAAGRRAA